MIDYNDIKQAIATNLPDNNKREITAAKLRSTLNEFVDKVQATEIGIESEINTKITRLENAGYRFAGVATKDTNPNTPDARVFYIADGKGVYTNFDGINVTEDDVVILYYDISWHKVSAGIASQTSVDELNKKVDALALGEFYGYFPNSSSLPIDITTRGYAYVGLDNPYKIWNFNGESWSDSGTSIDMNDADEEDITRNMDGKLQFKDRAYGDGMGYVILRKDKTFAEQVVQANTIYEIRYDFNLGGLSVSLPANCDLVFNGGNVTNGKIVGNGTKTNFLDDDVFSGDFYFNGEYHCFNSSIDTPIVLSGKKCVFHNHFVLNSYLNFTNCIVSGIDVEIDGVSLQTTNSHQIAVKMDGGQLTNSKFTFKNNSVATMDKTKTFVVVYVDGNAIIEGCEFSDFNSTVYGNASCILVAPYSLYKISKCTFKNISAHSDGAAGGNEGSFRGIITSFSANKINLGFSEISECHFENIWSYTGTLQSPTEILDDCDGIYLAGRYNNEPLRVRDVVIRGCSFKNVRKRSIKVQQEGVTIENCSFDESGISSSSYVECTIGAQNKDITISKCLFNKCRVCISHLFSGKVTVDDCSINDCGFVILEVVLINQTLNIINSIIKNSDIINYDSSISGTGNVLINIIGSYLDLKSYSVRPNDCTIYYENCTLDTSRFNYKNSIYETYFTGAHINNCTINFDISGFDFSVTLISFVNELYIKDSIINIKVRYDESDESIKSTGYLFKSSYRVEGCVRVENVKINLDHVSDLSPFGGIALKPIDDSFFRGINVENTQTNVIISGGYLDYKPMVYEDIKLSDSQTLFLNECKNVILRNIGNEGVFSTLRQITVGYQEVSVLLDGVFCLVKEADPSLNRIFGVKTIGTRGYIYNGIDKTARRIFYLGGIATPLTYTNLDSDMSTDLPILKPTDAGTAKYSTTHSKIVLWNGSKWVDTLGTDV